MRFILLCFAVADCTPEDAAAQQARMLVLPAAFTERHVSNGTV
jgi:hypothetical protein